MGTILWYDTTDADVNAAVERYRRSVKRQTALRHALSPKYWGQRLRIGQAALYVGYLIVFSVLAFYNRQGLLLLLLSCTILYFVAVEVASISAAFYTDGLARLTKLHFRTSVMFDDDAAWRRLCDALGNYSLTQERLLSTAELSPQTIAEILRVYLKNVENNTKYNTCGQLAAGSATALRRLAVETAHELWQVL
jgi:hypothetical protein